MESDMDEAFRKKSSRRKTSTGDSSRKNHMEEDFRLETTRGRLTDVLKRHEDLKIRLSRDSDKLIFDRLVKEFAAADAAKTEEISLDGEQWNDGLLATIRERVLFTQILIITDMPFYVVSISLMLLMAALIFIDQVHIEAERKAMPDQANMPEDPHVQEKPTYRIGHKVICCLEGARIGIQYETFFAGEPCEVFHCVLESKSFLQKITVIEHSVPFFLPVREAETELLSSNAIKFIDYVGEIVQAYVDRREQVSLIKNLYGNQIGNLYHSLSYNLIDFAVDDFDCKVTISLRYADLASTLPSRIRVLAWPVHASKKILMAEQNASDIPVSHPVPALLSFAEDAFRTMSLPQAYADIVLRLPGVLKETFPHLEST